jgi:hypothetical protein
MLLFGNWGQQMDIEDQRREIRGLKQEMRRQARAAGAGAERRIEALEAENDELKLYLASLIRYLAGKGHIDVSEFREIVDAVDAQDGAADGKFDGKVV